MGLPIKLHVFDFDGTLFRSPEKPEDWSGGWWGRLESLSPPLVPERPDPDWWNGSVVSAAKSAISKPDEMAVMVTGRLKKFSARVKDLLKQAGLAGFDEIYFSSGGSTDAYKIAVMKEILSKYPTIRGVAIWEDRSEHLRKFADWVEAGGRAAYPHLITVPAHPVEESPSPERVASAYRVAARYKSKKKIETKDGDEAVVYEYGPRQVANRHKEKAERVENLRKSITDLRTQVKKDLTSEDDLTRMSALAVALMDETAERVGNHESADDGHFGVTGWQKKHLTFGNGKVTIKYVGKSGVKHEKVVESTPTVKALKALCDGKSGDDRVFDSEGNRLDPEDVNEYLKKFDVTAKDIRGFRANDEMCKALRSERAKGPKELPRARKEKDKILKAEFKRALETVADVVGHESATLKSQYLVPGLEDSYLHDGTIIKTLKVGTKTEGEKEDEATEAMVKPLPKAKPPRQDLRKRRLETDDADLDSTDDDLSLNYKKVADRFLLDYFSPPSFLKRGPV
jgi:DNA topoisomerase IB